MRAFSSEPKRSMRPSSVLDRELFRNIPTRISREGIPIVRTNCRFVMGAIIPPSHSRNWRERQDLNLQVAGLESAAPNRIALHSHIDRLSKTNKKPRPEPGSGYTAASRPLRHDSPHPLSGNDDVVFYESGLHVRTVLDYSYATLFVDPCQDNSTNQNGWIVRQFRFYTPR